MGTKPNQFVIIILLTSMLLLTSCANQTPDLAEKVSPTIPETAPQASQQIEDITPPPAIINPQTNSDQNVVNPENKTNSSKNYFVVIEGFAFSPKNSTIKRGDSITWVNRDSAIHTVVSDPSADLLFIPPIQSENLLAGSIYSVTFNDAGSYGYICGIHHSMQGTIIVKEG